MMGSRRMYPTAIAHTMLARLRYPAKFALDVCVEGVGVGVGVSAVGGLVGRRRVSIRWLWVWLGRVRGHG